MLLNTSGILSQVRRIEIKARGLSQELFAGEYHTAFKGKGMTFSEVRSYAIGDDVRDIDWNVTARYNTPYVKIFEEERELTVMLAIDMSGSIGFGTIGETKKELVAEIAATLAFSAIENNDKVGVLLFTDTVEKYIPPGKGKKHILYIIREILHFTPTGSTTKIEEALSVLNKLLKKRATTFLISDFMTNGDRELYRNELRLTARRHDLIAIVVTDRREQTLPRMGLVQFRDTETAQKIWVNTSSRKVRQSYEEQYIKVREERRNMMKLYGITYAEVFTGEDFVKPLLRIFSHR
ncbi:DUF58 domain-containing protein [Porphyromonas circumdentaria]|uniref:DUF58 domain-containing protein n=1 Tax=Porphyromonas circumdentaria TaxID=29524 RepID=UPI0026DBEE11|nr:DUF58 domain-containing protein [Porphyromonas circumdentaria]MDO4722047.1 DUF58 domain-containing protein [Porphyromonas circumdentaria]